MVVSSLDPHVSMCIFFLKKKLKRKNGKLCRCKILLSRLKEKSVQPEVHPVFKTAHSRHHGVFGGQQNKP